MWRKCECRAFICFYFHLYILFSLIYGFVSVSEFLFLFFIVKSAAALSALPQLKPSCHALREGRRVPTHCTDTSVCRSNFLQLYVAELGVGWVGGGLLLKYTRITFFLKTSHAHFQEQFTYFYCQPRPSQLSLQLCVSPQRASFTADKHHKVYFSLCVRTAWANDTQEPGRVSRDTRGGFLNRGKRETWAGQMSHPPLLRALCPTTFNSLEDKK